MASKLAAHTESELCSCRYHFTKSDEYCMILAVLSLPVYVDQNLPQQRKLDMCARALLVFGSFCLCAGRANSIVLIDASTTSAATAARTYSVVLTSSSPPLFFFAAHVSRQL
jgi:hypothetical protein